MILANERTIEVHASLEERRNKSVAQLAQIDEEKHKREESLSPQPNCFNWIYIFSFSNLCGEQVLVVSCTQQQTGQAKTCEFCLSIRLPWNPSLLLLSAWISMRSCGPSFGRVLPGSTRYSAFPIFVLISVRCQYVSEYRITSLFERKPKQTNIHCFFFCSLASSCCHLLNRRQRVSSASHTFDAQQWLHSCANTHDRCKWSRCSIDKSVWKLI